MKRKSKFVPISLTNSHRKRAKTEDEKEQRRVERVLRNRRAAQSSRERKRQEVEGLERRNKELEAMLHQAQQNNLALLEELRKFQRAPTSVMARAAPTFDALRPSPVTFSQELFSSQDGHGLSVDNAGSLEQLLTAMPSNSTVNPASLSPTLTPVPEMDEMDETETATDASPLADAAPVVKASPDATQHPAAMLCQDLQCRSAEATPTWLAASQQRLHPALALFLPLQLLLISTSTLASLCQRPMTQIAMSLKAGFSLPPTRPILNTIIWLVTNPSPSRTSTSATLSPTTTSHPTPSSNCNSKPAASRSPTRRSSTLRLKFLRKILTCSPTLARPLMDATMEALRLVSTEGCTVDRVSEDGVLASATANGKSSQLPQGKGCEAWFNGLKLPSKEVLITLLWVLRVEERRLEIRRQQTDSSSKPGKSGIPSKISTTSIYKLKVVPKRSLGGGLLDMPELRRLKRRRAE